MSRAVILVVVLYVVVYVVALGIVPLTSPDETRYAEIPREMIASGDWVVPRLNALRYFEKPPLGYWMTALSISVFGQNDFAVRLPSALAVGLTALIIAVLVMRLSGQWWTALLAAIVYLTSPLVFAVGSIAVLDNLLTLFLTAALAAFFYAFQEMRALNRISLLCLAGLSCGLAILAKGFLGLAVPGIVVASWVVLQNRWRDVLKIAGPSLLTALVVVLPWSLLIHWREPDFWRYFFWIEHVSRFLSPVGSTQHPAPVWFFLPILAVGILPWLPLLPAALAGYASARGRPEATRFILPWLVLPFLFFSVSSGKLAAYILPCLPPLAMLIALGLAASLERPRQTRLFRAGSVASALGALVAMPLLASLGRPFYGAGESWKWVLLLVALAWWSVAALASTVQPATRRRIWTYCAAPLLLLFALHLVYPRALETDHAFGRILRAQAPGITPETIVVTDSKAVHAACWYLDRSDLLIFARGGELTYGLDYDDAATRLLQPDDVVHLLAADTRTRPVAIILNRRIFEMGLENRLAGVARFLESRTDGNGLVVLRYRAVVAKGDDGVTGEGRPE